MKRVAALVLSAIMCLSMGMTAFAVESPEKKAETTINGTVVMLEQVKTLTPEQVEASKKATLESKKNEIAANKQLVPVYSEDIELPEGVEMPAGGIDITFYLPGLVKADSKVHVSHGKEDGTWENIAATAGEGTVTAHFTSLSPVVIYVEAEKEAEQTPPAPPAPPASTETEQTPPTPPAPPAPSATSPKTADANMALAAGMTVIFFAAAAAAGVQLKKNR